MKKLKICIAGLGNVGSSVVNLIEENSSYVETKSHLNLEIIGLSAKNKNKERSFDIKKYKWVETPIDLLNINDAKPDILIELIGYEKGISYDLVKSALNQKIHVVTGNKAMLALHGHELFNIAEKYDLDLDDYETINVLLVKEVKLIKAEVNNKKNTYAWLFYNCEKDEDKDKVHKHVPYFGGIYIFQISTVYTLGKGA